MLESGYATAFDVIYRDEATLATQIAFLETCFRDLPGPLLDAGCGTGRHLLSLRRRGWPIVGVDLSPAMLAAAQVSMSQATPARTVRQVADAGAPNLFGPFSGQAHQTNIARMTAFVCGDLRALPFGLGFAGILCMDSPLALLCEDDDMMAALRGFQRVLRPGGVLVAEVYDYVGSLGEAEIAPWTGRFPAPWGHIIVHETHRYDRTARLWEMAQDFTLHRAGRQERFTARHHLRIRTMDTYVAAIERAGFHVRELRTDYPGAPTATFSEHRMIFIAAR